MCTKSPVREIATIEGNIYTPKTDKLSQPMGKWAFFFFFSNYLQYEIHLDYDTYFSSVGNRHLPLAESKK